VLQDLQYFGALRWLYSTRLPAPLVGMKKGYRGSTTEWEGEAGLMPDSWLYHPLYTNTQTHTMGNKSNRKMNKFICLNCGVFFDAWDKRRKYCSRNCSMIHRHKINNHGTKFGKVYKVTKLNLEKWLVVYFAVFPQWTKKVLNELEKQINEWFILLLIKIMVKTLIRPRKIKKTKRQIRNIDKIRSRINQRIRFKDNPEKVRAQKRAWYKAHPEYRQSINRRAKQRLYRKTWKKRHPEYLKADKKRRKAKKEGASIVTHFNPKEIFMRDGWKCQICGGMVLKRAVVPHPMAPTIDHIIPLAEGGTHEPKNVQCAHFICNSKKRDKAVNDQLRIF